MAHRPIPRHVRIAAVAALTALATALPTSVAAASAPSGWRALAAADAPDTNPLEGFIPYSGSYSTFPHSMEWFYLPLDAVMTGPGAFDWTALEDQLDAIAARGHQAAFRFYLDYPGKPSGVPQYLLDAGLTTHPYDDFGNNGQSVSPDYDDPRLVAALDEFIAALGAAYDGDPRVGFVQLGLLGFWGEWHTWPHNGDPGTENWFASQAEQVRILDAYDAAFDETRLMVRYPSTDNAAHDIGYHDDSFAYSTLPGTGWHFMDLMRQAGTTEKWKDVPVAGELRPELQGCLFDLPMDCTSDGDNNFADGVAQTHASWLLNHYAFTPGYTGAAYDNALAAAKSLGYRLRVSAMRTGESRRGLTVSIRMRDDGVAPFSYDWPLQLAAVGRDGRVAKTWTTSWKLTGVQPGAPVEFSAALPDSGLRKGEYTLVLRAANPLRGGVPLRFANAGQDTTLPGWLTLGRTRVS
ncbi:uncharacterized protein DUF4832 [Actinocorallia herbida]|uniref:Uncharacterized protein DUF4832 n=1 Tax=Actinocorallia herbida TaxID=58109 RepID=A0A3N1D0C1_9ACTN|nr:DUF4832 domain-containing protein [Actinocorallia herbida]ROO86973.1 uncharacterized protein DUF4832 [Actinocorallia herbida]